MSEGVFNGGCCFTYFMVIGCSTLWATPNPRCRQQLCAVPGVQPLTTVHTRYCANSNLSSKAIPNPNPIRLHLLCRSRVPKEMWSGWDRGRGVEQSKWRCSLWGTPLYPYNNISLIIECGLHLRTTAHLL